MTSAAQDDNAVKRLNVLRGYFPTMKVGGITIFLCLEPPTNNRVIDDYMYLSTRLPSLLLLSLRHAKKLSFSEALFKCFSVAEPMLLAFCTDYIMKRSVRK